ncbi:condensation domain-containing protein [Actinoplanes sp. NPDC026619]|uniref:condensation domain-containing protein n=1 Tax=Actinoplanes sp. NPDC026619 TaxID=3155798 RepID=UPI0033F4DBE4
MQLTTVPLAANQAGRIALALGPHRWLKSPCFFGVWIRGAVDPALLGRALDQLVRRHSALRYRIDPDRQMAVCEPPDGWPLRIADLRGSDVPTRLAAELDALRAPFPLGSAPLRRAVLVRCTDTLALLGIAVDHIVFDGASVSPFLRDLERLCGGAPDVDGPDVDGPDVDGSDVDGSDVEGSDVEGSDVEGSDYTTFGAREAAWLSGPDGTAGLAYWRRQVPAAGPFSTGPLRRDGPARPAVHWSRDITTAHRRPFVPLVAALTRALRRRQPDAPLGLVFPISRRVWPGTRHAIGYYNNRVYLELPHDPSPDSLLPSVREAVSRALQHSVVPFEALLPPDEYDRRPAAPYLFLNVTDDPRSPALPGAETEFTWLTPGGVPATIHGITLICLVRPTGLMLDAVYDPGRVDGPALESVLEETATMMAGVR